MKNIVREMLMCFNISECLFFLFFGVFFYTFHIHCRKHGKILNDLTLETVIYMELVRQ